MSFDSFPEGLLFTLIVYRQKDILNAVLSLLNHYRYGAGTSTVVSAIGDQQSDIGNHQH